MNREHLEMQQQIRTLLLPPSYHATISILDTAFVAEIHMEEQPQIDMSTTINGDWWYLAAAFWAFSYQAACIHVRMALESNEIGIRYRVYQEEDKIRRFYSNGSVNRGVVQFVSISDTTEIRVTLEEEHWENRDYWNQVFEMLQETAREARTLRQKGIGQTFKQIIEEYYRLRTMDKSIRLKTLAEQANVNYDSLRQAKIRYDAENKKKLDIS